MRRSPKKGLWALLRRMFEKPKGRHLVAASTPPSPWPAAALGPEVTHRHSVNPVDSVPPGPTADSMSPSAITVGQAPSQAVSVPAGFATIRLIFTDGSVVALPEGSLEGRRAQYLARWVLEAGRRS
jgi:hypothetical protein